jgi:hypothetical protein
MNATLTHIGYEQTKEKLARLEKRLASLDSRKDLSPLHSAEARESYLQMIRQYKREIILYEAGTPAGEKTTK